MAVQLITEVAYHGMCHEIGTQEEVSYRRDMVDISEFLQNQLRRLNECEIMGSGSRKEGFRLKESDKDIMFIIPKHRVIWDTCMSHSELYNLHRQILIFCNTSESPLGFALLWLPLESPLEPFYSACVGVNGGLYLSSSKFREMRCPCATPNSTIHGPCRSERVGEMMLDYAHCLISDFWPPAASSWINRCHSWPPQHVTDDIVRNGCHFVPIGHKAGNHADFEWRISFSQAENKLVYSMNHTQFLTYGLLKLFLNEVINAGLSDEEKLLCSYHMKTAIFWAIQQNMLTQWRPESILAGFWICFKLVLKWVYEGVCPNFFIPLNNLFLNRIYGENQRNLFRRLNHLYEKGFFLLLQISSIRHYISQVLFFPRHIVYKNCSLGSEFVFDFHFSQEINRNDVLTTNNLQDCAKALLTIEQLICLPLTNNQVIMLQKLTATTLQSAAFVLHDKCVDKNDNKNTYIRDKKACHLLRLSMKFGYLSDMLYIAMFYYKTFRYKEALSIIDILKVRMSRPYVMFAGEEQRWAYTTAVGGRTWSTKMRQAITRNIMLDNEICYITELLLEQQSNYLSRGNRVIEIPPWILLSFLECLSSRLNDTLRSQAALDNLQALLSCDENVFVPKMNLYISWEILGICQQITGNIQAARFSFQQSLKQYLSLGIQLATRQRINAL